MLDLVIQDLAAFEPDRLQIRGGTGQTVCISDVSPAIVTLSGPLTSMHPTIRTSTLGDTGGRRDEGRLLFLRSNQEWKIGCVPLDTAPKAGILTKIAVDDRQQSVVGEMLSHR